jgi:hypothetical protein
MPHSNISRIRIFAAAFFVAISISTFVALPAHAQTPIGGNGTPATTNTPTPIGGNGTPSTGTTNTNGGGQTIQNPLKVDSLDALLKLVLKAVVDLGTIALTLAIIWVGFMFVMARGNSEAISKARSALVWTIIGGLILLGASAIGAVIQSTVNTL